MAIRRLCEICGFAALKISDPPRCWKHQDNVEATKEIEAKRRDGIIQNIESKNPEAKIESEEDSFLNWDNFLAMIRQLTDEVEAEVLKMKSSGMVEPEEGWHEFRQKLYWARAKERQIFEKRKAYLEKWKRENHR